MTAAITLSIVVAIAALAVFAGWFIGHGIALKVGRRMEAKYQRDIDRDLKGAAHV
jgi:hypothetical protein